MATDPAQLEARMAALLDELGSVGDDVRATAEEVVALVVELYGAGLERIVALLAGADDGGRALLERLGADEVVGAVLALHDLHPADVGRRVEAALDQVRPYLGSHAGGVEFMGVDAAGAAHLRLQGTCDGCPSSTVTVKLAIERAILDAVPEVVRVEVEGVEAPADEPGPACVPIELGAPRRAATVAAGS